MKARAKAMAQIADSPRRSDAPALLAGLHDPADRVRHWAIEGLRRLALVEPTLLGTIRLALRRRVGEDPSPKLRRLAAEPLGLPTTYLCIRKGPPLPVRVVTEKPPKDPRRSRPRRDRDARPASIADEIAMDGGGEEPSGEDA
jgi:hypothetical protein